MAQFMTLKVARCFWQNSSAAASTIMSLGTLQIDMRCFKICVHAVEQGLLLLLQVLEWCPKNNLVRKVLGAIKVAVGLSSCCLFCN